MNDARILDAMTDAVQATGALLLGLERPKRPAADRAETERRFAALDRLALDPLRERLADVSPNAVWTDEMDTRVPARGDAWVADAMDGAVQYLQGLPHWCVSLTLVRDRQAQAVVLHNPPLGETCTAARGQGAFRNGEVLVPSAKQDLGVALLGTSHPPTVAREPEAVEAAGRSLSALLPHVGAVRNLGPTSWQIADTAAGRMDGFWQFGTDDTNLLGPALVATEAGLTVTDLDGRPWSAGARSFLAAPAPLHDLILRAVNTGATADC
ncbi:inositol monophosphatase family protein [Streptacidiphilus monticola]|uniref:Inositol monophosphatase family protein n=1 Tax=Streptacidiphilus monticola TaxID=2161674 RepID=A0ABW1G276_9ACTN